MLAERDIEAAHPDAFDFVWGNLPSAKRAEFNRHLSSCRYCHAVVDEYSEIGRIIKLLPPHVEPSADLEDRIVSAMTAAMAEQRAEPDPQGDAEDRAATRVYQIPRRPPSAEAVTEVHPRPAEVPIDPPADRPASPESSAPPTVTRLPLWRRYRGRLAAIAAVAAAIVVAAIVASVSLGRGPAGVTVAIKLHATATATASGYGAATGQATARQDASGSWKISLTVAHLKSLGDSQWYQCWYVSGNRQQVASAGTFQVPGSGSGTFSMTSAVDPHDFPTMEITIGPPTKTGALTGTVVLSGQATL
jgi:anti-sigma-K factor RskA